MTAAYDTWKTACPPEATTLEELRVTLTFDPTPGVVAPWELTFEAFEADLDAIEAYSSDETRRAFWNGSMSLTSFPVDHTEAMGTIRWAYAMCASMGPATRLDDYGAVEYLWEVA